MPQSVKDALADAETLRLVLIGARETRVARATFREVGAAEVHGREAAAWTKSDDDEVAGYCATCAARAAFCACPGATRVSAPRTLPQPCAACGTPRAMLNGRHFRERRLKAGIALREMAARLNVSPAYISDMELGKRTFLPKYAAAYEGLRG